MNVQTNLVRTPGHAATFIDYFKLSRDESRAISRYGTILESVVKVAKCCLRGFLVSAILPLEFIAISIHGMKAWLNGTPGRFVVEHGARRMFRGVNSSADSIALLVAFIFRAELIQLVVNLRYLVPACEKGFDRVIKTIVETIVENLVALLQPLIRINPYAGYTILVLAAFVSFLLVEAILLYTCIAATLLVYFANVIVYYKALALQERQSNPAVAPDIRMNIVNFNRIIPAHLHFTNPELGVVNRRVIGYTPESYHERVTPTLKKISRIIKYFEQTNIAQRDSFLSRVLGYHYETSVNWEDLQGYTRGHKTRIRQQSTVNGKVVNKRFWELMDKCKNQMRKHKLNEYGATDLKTVPIFTTVKRLIKEGICTPEQLCQAATTEQNEFLENLNTFTNGEDFPNAKYMFSLLREAREILSKS